MARPSDVEDFAHRQARDDATPALKVTTDSVSAVAKARAAGGMSVGRAGQFARTQSPPAASFVVVNDISYLLDLDPSSAGKRMLALETTDDQSQGMTVTTGYQVRDAEEHADQADIAPGDNFGPWARDHMLLIQFGTANAPSVVEVDVCEGMAINIPGAKCEVTLLDYTFSRSNNSANLKAVRSHASAANGAVSTRAQATQKVFCPFQIQLDLNDPPTFQELKQRLIEAVTVGRLTATGAP